MSFNIFNIQNNIRNISIKDPIEFDCEEENVKHKTCKLTLIKKFGNLCDPFAIVLDDTEDKLEKLMENLKI